MKIVAIINRSATVDHVLATVAHLLSREGQHSVDVIYPRYERDPSYMPTEEMPTAKRFESYRHHQRLHCATLKRKYDIWRSGLAVETPIRWGELVGHPARTVPAQVDDADIVVLGMRAESLYRDIAHTFRGLSLSKGRFIVLVPQSGAPAMSPASISIGWGHEQSVERLFAAMVPLMGQNAKVALHLGRRRIHTPSAPPSAVERMMVELSLSFEIVPATRSSDLYAQMRSYGADGLAILSDGLPCPPDAEGIPRPGGQLGAVHALVFRSSPMVPSWKALFGMPFQRKRIEAVRAAAFADGGEAEGRVAGMSCCPGRDATGGCDDGFADERHSRRA